MMVRKFFCFTKVQECQCTTGQSSALLHSTLSKKLQSSRDKLTLVAEKPTHYDHELRSVLHYKITGCRFVCKISFQACFWYSHTLIVLVGSLI